MNEPIDPSILPRFQGTDGKKRLTEALMPQTLIGGNRNLAEAIAKKASLFEFLPSTNVKIITQGDSDNDIYFIIAGSVIVSVNGREIARRNPGTHIGEMALIDTTARRSATITPGEPSLLARIKEKDFSDIAQKYPELWRRIAIELSSRLHERNKFIKAPRNQPVLFIGSSSEHLEIANQIKLTLAQDPIVVKIWTEGIFKPSKTYIEDLLTAVSDSDYAILVISQDDIVKSRGIKHHGPRDNVLFELGLFLGGLGRERTFFVKPRHKDIKIPTDLLGVNPLEYEDGPQKTIATRIYPVCTTLRQIILENGPR